jgi:hypothetical protein
MKMVDNYTPIETLTGSLTIFERELKRLRWKPELPDLHEADVIHAWIILAFMPMIACLLVAVGAFFYLLTRSLPIWSIPTLIAIVVIIVPILLTLAISLYTVSATINFWHDRVQHEPLDLLRLTMPTDEVLLAQLLAVAELVVWRGMRWEAAIRLIQGIVAGVIIWAALLGMLALIPFLDTIRSTTLIVSETIWVAIWLRLYVREPLWRMRVLVAMSVSAASQSQDTNPTMIEAAGTTLGLILLQFGSVTAIGWVTLTLINMDRTGWWIIAWFVAGCFLTERLARAGYGALHDWYTRRTLHTLQGAAD